MIWKPSFSDCRVCARTFITVRFTSSYFCGIFNGQKKKNI